MAIIKKSTNKNAGEVVEKYHALLGEIKLDTATVKTVWRLP